MVLIFLHVVQQVSLAQVTDPNLNVAVSRTNQVIVLSWFGSNAMAYQAEASSNLTVWSNSGPVLPGNNAPLFATNPISGQSRGFFRVRRMLTTVTAAFDPGTGVLTITGDDFPNIITVSRNGAGNILVNGGSVAITGGVPTVANTTLMQIFGRAGNDLISLDETSGALPKANLFGEAGNDTLTGGSGADTINGGAGDDVIFGKGGTDILLGGADNDTLTGGDGDDQVFGEAGNDRFIWNPGDDTDLNEGSSETDTVEINGGNGAEVFTTTANGTRVRFDRLDPAPFSLDIGTCENLILNASGGNDSFSATGNLAALIQITVDGGAGDDTILGSNGADLLMGGDNNDFIDGQQGNDAVFLGAGDDTFQWDPGDGSDTVEGQDGNDKLLFNGSAGAEIFEVSTNGTRVRFTRNLGSVVMDLDNVETIELNALGNTDTVTVNDLSVTDLTSVNINLATTIGGNTGDASVDTVIINGTQGGDTINVVGAGTSVSVFGLSAQVNITNAEAANDSLVINALGGDDGVTATTLPAGIVKLTIDGGAGGDTLLGSQGDDLFLGGDGDDFIFGDNGNDLALMGANDDVFQWEPGDGSDTIEGQAGTDTLVFNGSNSAENVDLQPNGSRLLFFRNVGNVTLDCDDVEKVQVKALGGTDNIAVGDLTATDVNGLYMDLSGPAGGGDASADSIAVSGTQTNDNVFVTGAPGTFTIKGLSASVTVTNCESANDTLTINALGGLDVVDASALPANVIKLILNGGLGNDTLIGSAGGDSFTGGDGNDLVFGGAGNDTFIWNPGDDNDTFEGQADTDILQFNGANVAENIDISANGTRLSFFRNVASVITDCGGVEIVRYEALGGADNIVITDLSATDVTAVNINLASTLGGNTGDAQPDNVYINGTGVADTVTVSGSGTTATVSGLSATVTITVCEAANDRVTIYTLGGDDILDASALPAGIISLTADGGAHNDTLIGSGGADVLLGSDGDDVLIGGPGVDILDGGPGNNTIIQ